VVPAGSVKSGRLAALTLYKSIVSYSLLQHQHHSLICPFCRLSNLSLLLARPYLARRLC